MASIPSPYDLEKIYVKLEELHLDLIEIKTTLAAQNEKNFRYDSNIERLTTLVQSHEKDLNELKIMIAGNSNQLSMASKFLWLVIGAIVTVVATMVMASL